MIYLSVEQWSFTPGKYTLLTFGVIMQFLFICIGSCPSDAAASLIEGTKCTSLGEVADGPRWENVTSILKYINGDQCPDKIRKKTTVLRLKCDESQIVSGFLLLGFCVHASRWTYKYLYFRC